MKKFTKFEKTVIMNTAKSSYVLVDKESKLTAALEEKRKKMEERFAKETAKITAEIESNKALLDKFEAPILELTGGKHSWELVNKSIEESVDDEGKVSKKTKFSFIEEPEPEEDAPEVQAEGVPSDAEPAEGMAENSDGTEENNQPEEDPFNL